MLPPSPSVPELIYSIHTEYKYSRHTVQKPQSLPPFPPFFLRGKKGGEGKTRGR